MLETELKCMLTYEQYNQIRLMFDWDCVKEQVNHYYSDSQNLLKRNGITLRVRTKDGINKIQVKKHTNTVSSLQVSEETEFETGNIPDDFSCDEVEKMTGLAVSATLLGSLSTLRHSLFYAEGVEICLDKNDYINKTDYEIEIEYTEKIPLELLDKLKECGVEFTDIAVGKCTRFMKRLAAFLHGEP